MFDCVCCMLYYLMSTVYCIDRCYKSGRSDHVKSVYSTVLFPVTHCLV